MLDFYHYYTQQMNKDINYKIITQILQFKKTSTNQKNKLI